MWQQYAPDPKMKLNLGIRRRFAPLMDNDIQKMKQANAILFPYPVHPSSIMVMRSEWVTTSICLIAMVYAPLCNGQPKQKMPVSLKDYTLRAGDRKP
jgi:hypothetical protein